MQPKQLLLKMMSKALLQVNGRQRVSQWLAANKRDVERIWVIAIGKAAESMYQGAADHFADQLQGALVISKYGHITHAHSLADGKVRCMEAGHPYSDENSLKAGSLLLEFIDSIPACAPVLFLISGGASSLVEVVPKHVSASDLYKFNEWLVAQGWPIHIMNACRKSVSLIKAGRLARQLGNRPVTQLLISDVPHNDISVIGSGLLAAEPADGPSLPVLPAWVTRMQTGITAQPEEDATCFSNIQSNVIADNKLLRDAVAALAIENQIVVQVNESIEGEIHTIGENIAHQLKHGKQGCYIWGGEGVIKLPDNPGKGGRCQALALEVACHLQGCNAVFLLAAGSDGTDGPGDIAGALIDGQTLVRGTDAGLDEKLARQHADAGTFLAASGDLIDTGPTGTNVMDLVVGLKI
jgi:glycerate 2-kinase